MKGLTISGGVHDVPDIGGVVLDVALELRGQRGVAGGDAVVCCALEDGKMGGRLRDHRRGLDTGGAGADLTDLFSGKIHSFMRPLPGVVPASLKPLEAWNIRHIRRGQATDGADQKPRGE